MKQNFRHYLIENLQESKRDKKKKKIIKEFQKQVKTIFDLKKYSEKKDDGSAFTAEYTITDIIANNIEFQQTLLGVEFINDQTLIKTQINPFDFMGRAKYINTPLRKKCKIRQIDEFNVECKTTYKPSNMTPTQLAGAKSGLLSAVFSFCGSYTDYVEGTECPILFIEKIPEELVKNFNIYPDEIEKILLLSQKQE